jgi:hypothetical protein
MWVLDQSSSGVMHRRWASPMATTAGKCISAFPALPALGREERPLLTRVEKQSAMNAVAAQ